MLSIALPQQLLPATTILLSYIDNQSTFVTEKKYLPNSIQFQDPISRIPNLEVRTGLFHMVPEIGKSGFTARYHTAYPQCTVYSHKSQTCIKY